MLDMDPRHDWYDEDLYRSVEGQRSKELELDTICLREFADLELPRREMLLDPILPARGLGMLFAGRGIGKTHVALGIGYAVSTGSSFLRWQAEEPRNVLYVDGEMPQQLLQDRLLGLIAGGELPAEDAFRLLALDRQALGTSVNLAEPKHQKAIDAHLGDAELLILDNMSTLMNGGPENDAESWNGMQAWLLQLRRRGLTVLIVHHASRGGNARGTSKREDVLDTIIQLKHPDGYHPSEGARFEVHLTKARGLFGDAAEPFEACLHVNDAGESKWECSDIGDAESDLREQICELDKSGLSRREIAKELGIDKMKVQRILKAETK